MNRYPKWKYVVILVALVFGVLYSTPNFFGEVPAVQVSPANSVIKIDQALMQRVENALSGADIAFDGMILDQVGVKVRFQNTEVQMRAKDVVQKALGENYTVALNLLPATPGWMRALNALPMYLGLDLRGGVHFLMQVDMDAALAKQLDRRVNDLRTILRDEKVPAAGVGREGRQLVVRFREAALADQGYEALRKGLRDMTVARIDATRIAATLSEEGMRAFQDQALQQNVVTLRNRVNELGVAEPVIQRQGVDRVIVQLPGVQDTAKAKDILGRTASLEIRMVDEENMTPSVLEQAARGIVPPGSEFYYNARDGESLLIRKQIILTGEDIANAAAGFDGRTSEPAVHITLDTRGARIFAQTTRESVGRRMAIILVEKGKGEVVTAPVIRQQIDGGQVQITGRMSVQDSADIALLLRAGALAAPMEIIEERTIGPSLGAENITKGVHSVLWGFAAIALFMVVYYRRVGLCSVLALGFNLVLLVAALSFMQMTLTLPGIAAIALTIGMAIDANVLINERIREEIRNGVTPHAAINAGYDHAFRTILDANVTSFIAGAALFIWGSGPVRGFAVVLCIGILTSMFSSILGSRALINLTYGRRRKIDHISI